MLTVDSQDDEIKLKILNAAHADSRTSIRVHSQQISTRRQVEFNRIGLLRARGQKRTAKTTTTTSQRREEAKGVKSVHGDRENVPRKKVP